MNKRTFIKTGLTGIAGITVLPGFASNSHVRKFLGNDTREFILPELDYDYNALEPYIDEQTMKLHHDMHHAGYTAKFNAAAKNEGITGKSAREILSEVSKYPDSIRNNGGGFLNHKIFWKILSPNGGGEPSGELLNAINRDFGSFQNFKSVFSKSALTMFGSGWAWLILQDGKLKVTQTANQDNPIMDIVTEKGKPLLCIDVWEHAYYLKYQNRRADYIEAFWNIVNWNEVQSKFSK